MKFRYSRYPTTDLRVFVEYPTVKVGIVNIKTKQVFADYIVLVDSGAAACIFHAGIGEAIGIDIKSGIEAPFSGVVKGEGKQFLHSIVLIIGGHRIETEVGFSYDLNMPFGLLGQKGFFEKFRICFDLPKHEFEITPKFRSH
ncbi:hypothetical protein HYZ78_02825 [Candidatus Microgenomates bacterium]|nr:hypothetical protein [Candidatus Microgenomates bacterium]